ncbi:MAG TPA: twin-arginine translocase TatA/TatE family subunit [Ktedonobacterales bacterium]|nr:twin-arginine translocase TatA/TatE family subunit [Ktedonobacterales bacterium]
MLFGHLPELLLLLLVALLVFGPKRMIEMGSSFGKAFREFKEATKEMSWTNLLSGSEEEQKPSALSQLSQISQTYGSANNNGTSNGNGGTATSDPVATAPRVVDADAPGEEPSAG